MSGWRAVGHAGIQPAGAGLIGKLPGSASKALTPPTQTTFTKAPKDIHGLDAVRAEVRKELRELTDTLIELASDPTLEAQLAGLEKAYADKELPSLEALAGADDVPLRKALLFIMAQCMRWALSELDQGFRLIEDSKALDGKLTLGALLAVLRFSDNALDNAGVFSG